MEENDYEKYKKSFISWVSPGPDFPSIKGYLSGNHKETVYSAYISTHAGDTSPICLPNPLMNNDQSIRISEVDSLRREMGEMRKQLDALRQEKKELEKIKLADTELSRRLSV